MRQQTITVFDEFVPPSTTTTSSTQHNSILGAFDQIALHVVADNQTGAATLNIFVDHSGDARNWLQRNSQLMGPSGTISAQGDVRIALITGGFAQVHWADAGQANTGLIDYAGGSAASSTASMGTPLLPFVRLRVVMGSGGGAHVKIIASLRGTR
jgi:hypothetical protein